ncbi:MAG: YraN family protein [Neisseria sp.]|nr:YraN family protein [Neisseria sp.]
MRLNHPQGRAAEDAALAYLSAQGCVLLARNWHCPYGEIDLIMRHGDTIAFIEVKYRRTPAYGGAAYSITPAKLAKITRSAELYLLQNHQNGDCPCRIDAVLIEGGGPPVWYRNITG